MNINGTKFENNGDERLNLNHWYSVINACEKCINIVSFCADQMSLTDKQLKLTLQDINEKLKQASKMVDAISSIVSINSEHLNEDGNVEMTMTLSLSEPVLLSIPDPVKGVNDETK